MTTLEDPGPSSAYYRRFAQTADGPVLPPDHDDDPLFEPAQSPTQFLDAAAHDGLYGILNVPRDASLTDLKDKYRALASIYHPDKQPDDARRAAAHARFTAIQRAYEVLSDPARRTVYDMFGEEGLRTTWDVGRPNMSPGQLRSHFVRQGETKRRLDAEALVNSRGDMSVVLDARAVFVPRTAFKDPSALSHSPLARIQRMRPGQILMKHSFETPINEQTQVVLEGTMAARGGAGGANVSGTIRHQFSPRFWVQYTQSVLTPRISSAKATYTFDENTYVTGNAIAQTTLAPPRMTVTLGRRLYPDTTGYMTFKSGFWSLGPWGADMPEQLRFADQSALSIGLTNAQRNGSGWTVEAQTGIMENALSCDWSTHVMGLKLKVGGSFDLMSGILAFADASGRITEHTRAGAMLQVQLQGGIQLRLHMSRIGNKFTVPILLSADLNPYVVLFSTVLPATAYAALHHFYLLPRKQRRIQNRIQELREEHAEYIEGKKAEAEDAVLLMERTVMQRALQERARDGLVVVAAHYGRATDFTPRGHNGDGAVVDVTVPVQALVQNSRLFIPSGRAKFNILGFWDPCIGENKKLRVRYLFRGQLHEVTVDDVGMLRAPVKGHALEE